MILRVIPLQNPQLSLLFKAVALCSECEIFDRVTKHGQILIFDVLYYHHKLITCMFQLVRKVVAGPKRTTNYQGIQLDLTYITERVIAMAFPASDLFQKTYRNKIEDVSHYLAENHGENYLIINVSSRIYDYQLFDQKVKDFQWPDHQAPTLATLISVGFEMFSFLRESKQNIVAVHCNHGKGRTGTAIITFFLLIGYAHSASECLKFYNFKRFNKETYGVDQPCQVRYLNYIEKLIQQPNIDRKLACYHLKQVTHKGLNENYYISIKSTRNQELVYDKIYCNSSIAQTPNKFLISDIFIELYLGNWMGEKRISRINYNLYFMDNTLTVKFHGRDIKVDHNHFKDFQVVLHFQYHCLCHLPTYNETLCTCNYVRNIQELQWKKMIDSIKICKRLSQEDKSQLVHGYKLIEHEEERQNQQKNDKLCESPKSMKNFRNSREQKLFCLSNNNKSNRQSLDQMLTEEQIKHPNAIYM